VGSGFPPRHDPFRLTDTHLREVLGDQTYESLARKGETMTTSAMATYAYGQIRPGPNRTERSLEIERRVGGACGGGTL
jgi:hypothetical protein